MNYSYLKPGGAGLIFYDLHYAVNLIQSSTAVKHVNMKQHTARIVKKKMKCLPGFLTVIYRTEKRRGGGEKKEAAVSPHHCTLLRVPVLNGFQKRWRTDTVNERVKGRRWLSKVRVGGPLSPRFNPVLVVAIN